MTIDPPDNNPPDNTPPTPGHNPDEPEIPRNIEPDIVPKSSILSPEDLALLAALGIEVSMKIWSYIFLSTLRERYHHGSMANMRVTIDKGHNALIFHYRETESSGWETVVIIYPGLTKEQVYLLARAISSGRVQAIIFGELERYLSENRYRSFPPYSKAVAINYPARITELQDLLDKCREARVKETQGRASQAHPNAPLTPPVMAAPNKEMDKIHDDYKREYKWKIMQGIIVGILLALAAYYVCKVLGTTPLNHRGNNSEFINP